MLSLKKKGTLGSFWYESITRNQVPFVSFLFLKLFPTAIVTKEFCPSFPSPITLFFQLVVSIDRSIILPVFLSTKNISPLLKDLN